MKVRALLFESRDVVRIVNPEVKEGKLILKKREWTLENSKATSLKTVPTIPIPKLRSETQEPFYFLYQGSAQPINVNFTKKGGNDPEFELVSPENLSNISRNTTLKTLLTLNKKVATIDFIMFIIIGLAIGYLLGSQIPLSTLI